MVEKTVCYKLGVYNHILNRLDNTIYYLQKYYNNQQDNKLKYGL